jgi:hypothetical protein
MEGIVKRGIIGEQDSPKDQGHHGQNDSNLNKGIQGYPNSLITVFI